MHGEPAFQEKHPRGVFRTTYQVHGYWALVAIDAEGNARKHIKLVPGLSEARATEWLEQWLDRIDPPRPQLRLVKDENRPCPRRPVTSLHPPAADPRAEDAISFALRMARQHASRFPTK